MSSTLIFHVFELAVRCLRDDDDDFLVSAMAKFVEVCNENMVKRTRWKHVRN